VGGASINGFQTAGESNTYNVERVGATRGPNAILFGTGAPGGVLNFRTRQPSTTRNQTSVDLKVAGESTKRSAVDINRVLLKDKLGLRLMSVWDRKGSPQPHQYQDFQGITLAANYRIKRDTELTVSYARDHNEGVSGRDWNHVDGLSRFTTALGAGQLRWNDLLPLTSEVQAGGAGWMGNKPIGSRFRVYEAATEMIRVSDNTATNLMIKRLGGSVAVNQRFRGLGLKATVINNWLPDLNGTNTTSSHDLARSIALVDSGEKLSPRARDLFREIMASSRTNTLIPAGLLKGLIKGKESSDPDSELLGLGISALNKTGDIGIAYADAALIELPNGQRAVAAFMVKGPFNDPRSSELIRAMAAAAARALVDTTNLPPQP
jgi:outer membrane receptor protein involved in Fe transport